MTLQSLVFQTAGEILFGRGKASEAARRILPFGRKVFLVHGRTPARADWMAAELEALGAEISGFAVPGEPDLPLIEMGIAAARASGSDVVVAIGGGSVIDAGKAIAALVRASGPIIDYLEVVGTGRVLEDDPLPFIALPTTAGTGAEVTKNAVIGVPEHRRKVSLRDPRMLARLAIVDPALTDNSPRRVTLESGLDAVTQVIEPYISSRANRLTDALCRDAIQSGLSALRILMLREEEAARDQIAWTSLCGGLALANSGLGVVHGLAGPLGGLSEAPHGAICGALLPYALAANRDAVTEPEKARRIEEVLGFIGQAFETTSGKALSALANWSRASGLMTLGGMGITAQDRQAAAEAALASSSMKANPVPLDQATLLAILEAAS
ncbi:iron-containing alcohol dehydrogenase [Gellertiella hungarica]|uniref:Alcohol dehydrogenase n=1 Tax=Gellertiella hungarica TaxID=1572859 RepID=A0A7W6J7N1_9HYPH|nr:iron-containing alcohol dehydrogenase [Gellertiella hungarica]MBB4066299.1 hypothetical protein [Gellertiella hungarica]